MPSGRLPSASRRLGIGLVTIVSVGVLASATLVADPDPRRGNPVAARAASQPGAACGSSSTAVVGEVDSTAARGIYTGELAGTELQEDLARVRNDVALSAAVASGNAQATRTAVSELVYMPGWHIVRLRVLRAGQPLADIGGPYVIAPVRSAITYEGRRVGTFVMSVQDDVGYVKLVSRFIGTPIDIYRSGSFLMGTLLPAPASLTPGGGIVRSSGAVYATRLASAKAFPAGSLRVALFVAPPPSPVTDGSCASVRAWAWGRIAQRIAALFQPLPAHYRDLVGLLQAVTGGHAYVGAGKVRLAGASRPAKLPDHGTVHLQGHTWSVYSWEPFPPARIFLLTRSG